MCDFEEPRVAMRAKAYVADGSVSDIAMGVRKACAIDAAGKIYFAAKIRIETERAIAAAIAEAEVRDDE
ncbi:hypothetical protein [Microbacterium arborescens]|uniref:hypothetical protein n=1 Tax=Microbacterium arborescens TaxID=33883 RepID=UPI0012EE6632|nr:hypothetical protein [Microbacterium arborescens]